MDNIPSESDDVIPITSSTDDVIGITASNYAQNTRKMYVLCVCTVPLVEYTYVLGHV